MNREREHAVTEAFVNLASSLANGYDVVDLLHQLTADCVRILEVSAAGLLLADALGELHLVAAAPERVRLLELFQLQRGQGPCYESFRTGLPVSVEDLTKAERWPQLAPAARDAGFRSVHALPLRLRDNVLGALGLFGAREGALPDEDLALGQALADVACVALVQQRAAADRVAVNEQLQEALVSRVVIEQAKGLLAQRGDLGMVAAFNVLRRYARDHNLRLTEVAQQVVSRQLSAGDLVEHARSSGVELA
jgi:GAF domain-containing protein